MNKYFWGIIGSFILLVTVCADANAQRSKLPAGAKINWIEPKNNGTYSNPIIFKFEAENIEIGPTKNKGSSHFHILYDRPDIATMIKGDDAFKPGPQLIPKDIHLGNGELEYELTLPPGRHTVQILLTDRNHVPHFPALFSEQRTITVK